MKKELGRTGHHEDDVRKECANAFAIRYSSYCLSPHLLLLPRRTWRHCRRGSRVLHLQCSNRGEAVPMCCCKRFVSFGYQLEIAIYQPSIQCSEGLSVPIVLVHFYLDIQTLFLVSLLKSHQCLYCLEVIFIIHYYKYLRQQLMLLRMKPL